MAEDLGNGVSRTLSALQRQFLGVVFQFKKPPLDSELNLQDAVHVERQRQFVQSHMHSGFLLDPTQAPLDFTAATAWSNFFKLGRTASDESTAVIWANVNGWLIPVTGTSTSEGDESNRVDLFPPPSSDSRIDLVFLEAFVSQVAPNPSTDNKPAADKVWKYGNVKYGGTNIDDDIQDTSIGFETTERLQVQYRIRVFGSGSGLGTSVALDDFPDGMDDPNVLGQGTATSPVVGFGYTNMRAALGDAGLWRAGDGDHTNDLGTLDGYTYAIPLCAVFRRNSDPFVARTAAGNANQNGAFDRNPSDTTFSDPAVGTKIFLTADLTNDISETTTGVVEVDNLVGSGLDNSDLTFPLFVTIEDEIIRISAVDTTVVPATMTILGTGRGRGGTAALPHVAGSTIAFFNTRMDGLYADEIHPNDILDLRKGVTLGDWDYTQLLIHNLTKLVQGDLRSSYKQAGIGDTQGPTVVEIDTVFADGSTAVPNQTEALDGPDGIRTVFSDGASIQPDVTMLLDDQAPQAAGFVSQFDSGTVWDAGAPFLPGGWMNDTGGWEDGSIIFLHVGGSGGGDGARATFRDGSDRAVRFLGPKEYWQAANATVGQTPFTLRFIEEPATSPAAGDETAVQHPGPLYPLQEANFEKPFLVLGGLINTNLQVTGSAGFNDSPGGGEYEVDLPGLDFDTAGVWFSLDGAGEFANDPSLVSESVLQGSRTLFSMLTKNGTDRTGASSEIYLVFFGDDSFNKNNGVWRVIGAGTAGYTDKDASAADRIRVEAIRAVGGGADFGATPPTANTAELRSQFLHSVDGDGATAGRAAVAIVLTDIHGTTFTTNNPWNATNLGALRFPAAGSAGDPIPSKMVLRTALQYHPGRGATARVADRIHRVATVNAGAEYLRQAVSTLDSTFEAESGSAGGETYFDTSHVQTWNRLSGLGLDAPDAPAYGGAIVSFTEQDRESEAFIDAGSKTLIFRPFLDRTMTLYKTDITTFVAGGQLIPTNYPAAAGGHPVDGAAIFAAGLATGYSLPPEFMPRFGRQDIPFFNDVAGTGLGTFLNGINHLFTDSQSNTLGQFNIVGGTPSGGGILPMRFQTGASSLDYGEFGTIEGSVSGYQARKFTDPLVQSSDLGRVLNGIQMPPFMGLARIYGVYDRRDYSGVDFDAGRVIVAAGAPTNLLRSGASKQTLFIVEGGAADVMATTGPDYDGLDDHTYVIPEEALDITLSSSFTAGETFSDLDFIVVAAVFGFSRGFINKNNYVMARISNGEGNPATVEPVDVHMCIPAPAPLNDQVYTGYVRTPYQGDPYMTRDGGTRVVSDYEHRYGQIPQASAFELSNPIQQFNTEGVTQVDTPNLRALEVLASLDFYTTLGTGKVAGAMSPGTPLDVSFTENTQLAAGRVPTADTDPPWQMRPRAFSQGQKDNPMLAGMTVVVLDNTAITGETVTITGPNSVSEPFLAVGGAPAANEFEVAGDIRATAANLAAAIAANATLALLMTVSYDGDAAVTLTALAGGAEGELLAVAISDLTALQLRLSEPVSSFGPVTKSFFRGGLDQVINAGTGSSSLDLTGMTERLPLGILLQDSDFLSEDPFNDGTSAMQSRLGSIQPIQALIPLTGGEEFTRLVGGPGNWVGMADGGILKYEAFHETTAPTGSRKYRLFRGGGSAFVLTGPNPGGPVDWVAGRLPSELRPVLKGGVLVCKALLVRNSHEQAFNTLNTVSHGDEIQMVILTKGILGKGTEQTDGVALTGTISPTGYGEGYAAADRYRLEGKPLVAGRVREHPDTAVELATFPFDDLTINTEW